MNYNKRNINILSLFISIIIFVILILILKKLNLNKTHISSENIKNNENEIQVIKNKEDISVEKIFKWKIIIEKLNLEAYINEGVENEIIKESVGHYTTSAYFQGLIALKAYNTGKDKNFFANLKELEIGDEIKYIVNEEEKTFKVISNIIINDEKEYTEKKENEEKNILILITYVKDMADKVRCVISEENINMK